MAAVLGDGAFDGVAEVSPNTDLGVANAGD
jgi:hypothetical protein